MTMVWYLARGAGIPALKDAIDVCVSKHQSVLIGGNGDSQLHRRAEGLRTYDARADKRKPSFLVQARIRRAQSEKQSILLTVGGARF